MIDWSKVAVFHNTQYAESEVVADYYAAQRGIPGANVQGFDFGTADVMGTDNTTRDALIAGLLTDIDDFIASNSIEAVALSTHCPRYFAHDPESVETDTAEKQASLCRTISDVDRVVTLGGNTAPTAELPTYESLSYPNGSNGEAGDDRIYHVRLKSAPAGGYVADWRDVTTTRFGYRHVLCGRLGYHESMTADDTDTAKRCIDDAIWFESNGDVLNAPVLCGMSQRATYLEWGQGWMAYHALAGKLRNVYTYDGGSDGLASRKYSADNWGVDLPPVTISDQVTWLLGGGPVLDLWGWVGTGLMNNDDAYLPSVSFQRGSWMFESTSTGVSKYSLPEGTCSVVVPLTEPYSDGLPTIGAFVRYLSRGFSIEEARAMSQPGPASRALVSEAWGDPFYSPFLNKNLGSFGVISF